jgi:hypothetical protein
VATGSTIVVQYCQSKFLKGVGNNLESDVFFMPILNDKMDFGSSPFISHTIFKRRLDVEAKSIEHCSNSQDA